ncbi:MAG: cell division protein SepF [Oscillospiraceae bacterium]|nr:cell division protein SepF [Oscillospiraceae bacterium]MBQ9843861.1 cell division protein SepF [Oscillospiraceae bacterium]
MSIWDNLKKFTRPYADEEYDDYEDEDELEDYEEEVAEPARSGRSGRRPNPFKLNNDVEEDSFDIDTTPAAPTPAPSAPIGFSGKVVSGNKQEVVLFHPSNFNDTSKAADDLRSKKVVILNLENVDKAMARRVVDFLSGCSYALDGKVRKVAQSTYLFCPYNMDVVGDLENLQSEVESYI